MNALLAGATGLVGQELVQLAADAGYPLTTVGRRDVEGVAATIRTDFSSALALPPARVALCALGTTMAAAGSRADFYAVDHDAVLYFARSAHAVGIQHFVAITAVGAHVRSPVFYSKVKGEIERDLAALGFARLDIVRPGLLLGRRRERRPGEALLQRLDPMLRRLTIGPLDRYSGISAVTVASAMLALCNQSSEGTHIHHNADLRRLAHTC
ncbi:NAD-dependent epimerase/dehydratase family protein [Pseudohaliea rubra]|uniref:NAD-dependent epimerase/dehydratase family protein n=1 Tax=Pseudohaliea rubra TaxID=475795 RepID=UPI000689BDCA|nr:NAD-dependent epimerase/dehydratase family protein [Pseudohaliea rubra]